MWNGFEVVHKIIFNYGDEDGRRSGEEKAIAAAKEKSPHHPVVRQSAISLRMTDILAASVGRYD